MPPGAARAACTARAASAATDRELLDSQIQDDTGRAKPTMSEVSGASYCRWWVAWSPTTLMIGDAARRALCRFARPLASPGPRCNSTTAGFSAMRP